ncbi:MAG: hypothetical protein KF781_05230 [Chitinophagaceae bacterium]|nr:hypothetical protein [Chitinophagaceae bacterium]MCW5905920.1 hypothetical protein [Chitinophagaceae bacterium]
MWSPSEDIMDAAFWKVIYENKSTFKVGGQYKLKVTLYASRDGNRGEKLAEGTVTLTYTDKSANEMERQMKAMRDVMED